MGKFQHNFQLTIHSLKLLRILKSKELHSYSQYPHPLLRRRRSDQYKVRKNKMKLTCEKKVFEDAISVTMRSINPRSPLPILSHLLIEATPGQIKITASDLDVGITVTIEADVSSSGSLSCPARIIGEIIPKLPAGVVSLATPTDGRLLISCGSAKFEVASLPAEEYPSLPTIENGVPLTLPQDLLKTAIRQVAIATASPQDEARLIMTGISLILSSGSLILVATDGRRLASVHKDVELSMPEDDRIQVVVPSRGLVELNRLMAGHDSLVMIVGSSQVYFQFGPYLLHCRLLEGSFPDHTKVIPKSFLRSCRIGREVFLAALRRMLVVAQEKRSPHLIKLAFTEDTLTLSAHTPDLGSGEERIPVSFSGEDLVIGFNGKYLVDGLLVLEDEEVQFDLQEESKSAVIRPLQDTSYDYVIMPVKLRDTSDDYDHDHAYS